MFSALSGLSPLAQQAYKLPTNCPPLGAAVVPYRYCSLAGQPLTTDWPPLRTCPVPSSGPSFFCQLRSRIVRTVAGQAPAGSEGPDLLQTLPSQSCVT